MSVVAMVTLGVQQYGLPLTKAGLPTAAAKTESNAEHLIWNHPWGKPSSYFLAKLIKLYSSPKMLISFYRNWYIL